MNNFLITLCCKNCSLIYVKLTLFAMNATKINIEKHISELLYLFDCVIIPDFGGILTNYNPATISKDGKYIFPPSKSLSFNKNLNKSDGLLINHIAEKNKISYSESKQHIANFVRDTFLSLDNNEKVTITNIGSFIFDKNLNLIFDPNTEINYLTESFGLTSINFQIADRQIAKKISSEFADKKNVKNLLLSSTAIKLYIIIPIIAIISFLSTNKNLLNNLNLNYSSFTSIDSGALFEKESSNIIEKKLDSMTKKENALFYSEPKFIEPNNTDSIIVQILSDSTNIINDSLNSTKELIAENSEEKEIITPKDTEPSIKNANTKGNFVLISGSFSTKNKAEKHLKKLQAKGFSPEIILMDGNYRISLASFNLKEDATNESKKIKEEHNISSWVSKR